jgi:hypothetical protein
VPIPIFSFAHLQEKLLVCVVLLESEGPRALVDEDKAGEDLD